MYTQNPPIYVNFSDSRVYIGSILQHLVKYLTALHLMGDGDTQLGLYYHGSTERLLSKWVP